MKGKERRGKEGEIEKKIPAHIVVSTSSMVILPWICFMAAPAFFMATRVSWLMFADSME